MLVVFRSTLSDDFLRSRNFQAGGRCSTYVCKVRSLGIKAKVQTKACRILRLPGPFFKKLWPVPLHATVALLCTLGSNTFIAMAILLPPVFAPLAAPQVGYAESDTGLFMAIVSITGVVAATVSGMLLSLVGAVGVLQLSLVFCAVGLVLLSTAELWLTIVAAMVMGVGYGAITPACSQILFQVSPASHRSLVFSLNQIGVPLGGVVAGTLLPTLSSSLGWRGATASIAATGIVAALILSVLHGRAYAEIRSGLQGERRQTLAGVRLVLADTQLRRMILPSISFAIIQLCLGTFLVSFLTRNVRFTLAEAGGVLALSQGAGIIGRILWGWVADQTLNSLKVLPVIGVLMSAATFFVASFMPSWPHSLIFFVAIVLGGTALGWNGVYLAEVARLAPVGEAGAVTGSALALTLMGSMFGPPFFTIVVAISGSYPLAFSFIAVFALLSGLSILWPSKPPR
jgi:MFS family permease